MEDKDDEDGKRDIVANGQAVSVPLLMRDSTWTGSTLEVGDRLRDLDTGAVVLLDRAHIAAIRCQAARESMPVARYLSDRLRYSIERG